MPSTPQVIRMRRRRWKKYHDTPTQRAGLGLVLFLSISFLICISGFTYFYSIATEDLPSLQSLPLLLEAPGGFLLQPTRFYDRSGAHVIYEVENPAIEKRKYIQIGTSAENGDAGETLPQSLINSTIAISDPSFLNHLGFSTSGIQDNSHNTIAQRLVSELLLWDETPGVWRAVRERILAAQITSHFGREKVMEWYLNSTNYGSLAFGAEQAAQIYFGKSVSHINLAEAAILAAVSEAPALNPLDSPETALQRGKIVIDAMHGQGLITIKEAEAAKDTQITFLEPAPSRNTLAPAFIDLTWDHLSNSVPVSRIERGGFQIITSLDYDLQLQTTCTTQTHLTRILKENNDLITPAALENEQCEAAKLLPTLTLDDGAIPQSLATEVVILDPLTGQILALVGGLGGGPNDQIADGHPPGSLFTPFIYLTAFTRGFNPASLLWDIPFETPEIQDTIGDDLEFTGPLRLRNALANDYLIPAIQLINQVGSENVLKTARDLGLESMSLSGSDLSANQCPGCQIFLGEGKISLLEAVQAFGVFTNQGYLVGQVADENFSEGIQHLNPVTVLNVHDITNQTWIADPQVEIRPVISNQLAYLMTDILSDEAARWPSLNHPNPLEIGRPAGAKMGTTTSGNDVWTVGFTPQLVVGIWMGTPENSEASLFPQKAASVLWHAVIQYAAQDYPADNWAAPPGITTMDVCDPSGMLPTLQCPTIVSEVFLEGQEPTQPDTLYQVYQVNRETERLATVYTPPDLVEERIYLNVPPEANAWAESQNLAAPPEIYDLIYVPETRSDVGIESPQMFQYLKGEMTIIGRAAGEGFESYRLQAGEGINPSGWIVVEDDAFSPVVDGILGTWDTSGLNGLYALQLIVLRENQRVDTATIQVTLDNIPPEVSISYPQDLSFFSSEQDKTITFLVESNDNLGLESVEFYIDNRLVTTQNQPPFAYPWSSRLGTFTLTVKSIDFAGNISEASVSFIVD